MPLICKDCLVYQKRCYNCNNGDQFVSLKDLADKIRGETVGEAAARFCREAKEDKS